jgi:hypothetical protein
MTLVLNVPAFFLHNYTCSAVAAAGGMAFHLEKGEKSVAKIFPKGRKGWEDSISAVPLCRFSPYILYCWDVVCFRSWNRRAWCSGERRAFIFSADGGRGQIATVMVRDAIRRMVSV